MKSQYICPMCNEPLDVFPGNGVSATDGITLSCMNRACPPQEVMGHGKNEKEAFEIVKARFCEKIR